MFLTTKLITLFVVIVANGSTSVHLVKQSTTIDGVFRTTFGYGQHINDINSVDCK